ncbi:hypothetical protein ABHI18_008238 [Aspergillus niger]
MGQPSIRNDVPWPSNTNRTRKEQQRIKLRFSSIRRAVKLTYTAKGL